MTEYEIKAETTATVFIRNTSSNTTMFWIYPWEFDINNYQHLYVGPSGASMSLSSGEGVAILAGNVNVGDVTVNRQILSVTYYQNVTSKS